MKSNKVEPETNKQTKIIINDNRLWELSDNMKCNNIGIIGFPEGEEREKEPECI